MLHRTFRLSDEFSVLADARSDAALTAYVPDPITEIGLTGPRASILVISGGGYRSVSQRESEPIALAFAALGYNTFCLDYSVAPETFPTQLLEALAAAAFLRRHANQLLVDPDRIVAMGFSAGAHLAGSLGILGQRKEFYETLGLTAAETRLAAMVLCYPVITSGRFAHADSFRALLGENPEKRLLELVSLEKQVTPETPPTFLWHTKTDPVVPYQNSLLFAESLKRSGVPHELHLYEQGIHALSLATKVTAVPGKAEYLSRDVAGWVGLCADFLERTLYPNK